MTLLVNGAGVSAANPILDGLRLALYFGASTMDIAQINGAWLDQAAGFPGTNSVSASLSPTAATLTAGVAGSYNDTTDQLTISSTAGLTAGDGIYVSHASITDGIYVINSVVNGTAITLRNDPFAGGGNVTSVAYQVAWKYEQTAGTAPIVSSAGGQVNYFKVDAEDGAALNTEYAESFYVRDAPAGDAYIALDGLPYSGTTFNDTTLTLALLAAWANKGGVATIQLIAHSVQATNNFTWNGGGTEERTVTAAEAAGLAMSAGDGAKYGALRLRSFAGSANYIDVDIDAVLDTAGPSIVMIAFGA